jgi:hypothetical protein
MNEQVCTILVEGGCILIVNSEQMIGGWSGRCANHTLWEVHIILM